MLKFWTKQTRNDIFTPRIGHYLSSRLHIYISGASWNVLCLLSILTGNLVLYLVTSFSQVRKLSLKADEPLVGQQHEQHDLNSYFKKEEEEVNTIVIEHFNNIFFHNQTWQQAACQSIMFCPTGKSVLSTIIYAYLLPTELIITPFSILTNIALTLFMNLFSVGHIFVYMYILWAPRICFHIIMQVFSFPYTYPFQ